MKFFRGLFVVSWCLFLGGSALAQDDAGRIGGGKYREVQPVLHPNGGELYFVRPDHKSNQGKDNAPDVWMRSRGTDGNWGRALNPGSPINSLHTDRPLSMSPDGNRLAVRRQEISTIDILQRNGRGWEILASLQVPQTVSKSMEWGFSCTSGELIFTVESGTNGTDLHVIRPRPQGGWTTPEALTPTNSVANDSRPFFAPDGRTLYFFRSGDGWYKQDDRAATPVRTQVPINGRAFALPLPTADGNPAGVVAIGTDNGNVAELRSLYLSNRDRPLAGRPVDVAATGFPLSLTTGSSLTTFPAGRIARHVVYLRDNERPADGAQLDDLDDIGPAPGGRATDTYLPGSARLQDLEARIAATEQALSRLDRERRQALGVLQDDLERDQAELEQSAVRDTVPDGSSVRERYAADMEELAAMKRRFVRQQEERRRGRDDGAWARRAEEQELEPIRPIGESYTPAPDPNESRALRQADSLDRVSRIRQGLDRTPDRNGRTWERRVSRDLPAQHRARVADIDSEYERQLTELERLRAEVARLRGEVGTVPDSPSPALPVAKGGRPVLGDEYGGRGGVPRPAAYSGPAPASAQKETYSPVVEERNLRVSFIENTAYPDGDGYTGLEQLFRRVRDARDVVEIRVHTPVEMDRRAAQLLSEERAVTIRNYLVEEGIPVRRFRVVGYGNNETGALGERVELL